MQLTFLGTRGEIDIRSRRHRRHSALMILHRRARIMIDCGLDWLHLLRRQHPDAIVLTHAHPDHAWGLKAGAPCPVYAPKETFSGLSGFEIEDKRLVRRRKPFSIAGVTFEAFSVEHSIRAPAVGYRIALGRSSIFYVPDVVYIRQRRAALAGIDLFIGDGASISRPLVRRRGESLVGHAPISAQLTWCRKAGIKRAIITHCGSGIVSDESSAAKLVTALGEHRGVEVNIAHDGMNLRI